MPLRIALTGATGFVGSAVLPLLLDVGHDVVALVRNPARAKLDSRARLFEGDLLDQNKLSAFTRDADVVLHVAGVVSGVRRSDFFDANTSGSIALAQAAHDNGVQRFVLVSSLAAREAQLNDYAASKAAAEVGVQAIYKSGLTILRPSAVYGPGDKATLPLLKAIMSSLAVIPGSADARFSMIHVADLARILVQAVRENRSGRYELDDGAGGHSWAELIEVCRSDFGKPGRYMFLPRGVAFALAKIGDGWGALSGKPALVNSGQMRQLYHGDWRVTGLAWALPDPMGISKGLSETIRWYQAHGLLPQGAVPDRRAAIEIKD